MTKENTPTIQTVRELARKLHANQVDKGNTPYFFHVESVALALAPFGDEAMMVGYLHDSIEDTDITAEDLHKIYGIPDNVIESVRFMSRNLYSENQTYMDMIRVIASTGTYHSRLAKIADNAHNSRLDRVIENASQEAMDFSAKRYSRARKILYPSVSRNDVRTILENVNPYLLAELDD